MPCTEPIWTWALHEYEIGIYSGTDYFDSEEEAEDYKDELEDNNGPSSATGYYIEQIITNNITCASDHFPVIFSFNH